MSKSISACCHSDASSQPLMSKSIRACCHSNASSKPLISKSISACCQSDASSQPLMSKSISSACCHSDASSQPLISKSISACCQSDAPTIDVRAYYFRSCSPPIMTCICTSVSDVATLSIIMYVWAPIDRILPPGKRASKHMGLCLPPRKRSFSQSSLSPLAQMGGGYSPAATIANLACQGAIQ